MASGAKGCGFESLLAYKAKSYIFNWKMVTIILSLREWIGTDRNKFYTYFIPRHLKPTNLYSFWPICPTRLAHFHFSAILPRFCWQNVIFVVFFQQISIHRDQFQKSLKNPWGVASERRRDKVSQSIKCKSFLLNKGSYAVWPCISTYIGWVGISVYTEWPSRSIVRFVNKSHK